MTFSCVTIHHIMIWRRPTMKTFIKKYIPLYGIIPLLCCFALNMLVYSGAMSICAEWKHYDLTTGFDRMVPLVPWWMYIYFGCYLFWIVNYIMTARIYEDEPSKFYQFVTTDMMSRIVCGFFFFLLPTTNIRPEVVGETFADTLLRFLYTIDQPANLFPSIHCLVSWMCYIGIRGNKKVPAWYRGFSCVFALLVVISTQTTKQHYIVDAVAGLFLAEVLYAINKRIHVYKYVQTFFDSINRKLGFLNKEKIIE